MKEKNISRRSFLKLFGSGTVVTAAALAGCKGGNKAGSQAAEEYKNQVEPPVGQMTYRENPKTKEKVSLLGYGMMRLPTKPDNEESPMIPAINEAACIGCGACEYVCPSHPFSAIYVEGHEVHKSI